MSAISPEQHPEHYRNSVIVGAGGAIGRALVAACLADPRCGTVFALSRTASRADLRAGQPDAVGEQPDHARERSPDRDRPREQGSNTGIERSLLPEGSPSRDPHRLVADPTDPDSLAAAVEAVRAVTPRVHRLIVCTGILHGGAADPGLRPEKSLRQLHLTNLQQCMAVNAWAPLMMLEAFAPLLRHEEGAVAAALSAMVGSIGDNRLGGWYSYRMSKAALNMGVRNVAIELGRQRHAPVVVAIHPGTTRSELSAPFAGAERARPASASAAAILQVLDGLRPEQTGRFFNWDGRELPW